jgi:hypothetical protein
MKSVRQEELLSKSWRVGKSCNLKTGMVVLAEKNSTGERLQRMVPLPQFEKADSVKCIYAMVPCGV